MGISKKSAALTEFSFNWTRVMPKFELESAPVHRYQHVDWDSERWRGFNPRDGDIYICTCYKSGTTWTQMIAALLVFQSPDLPKPLNELSPWLDLVTDSKENAQALLEAQTHRRILKTHTPLDGLRWQPNAKYLFVARDPRDVFVSMMNHQDNTDIETEKALAAEMGQSHTVSELLADNTEDILKEWLTRGYFAWERDGYPYWSAFHHGETFWQHRHRDNILMLHFNQLKADLSTQMRRIADFLQIEIDEAVFPSLVNAAGFSAMKKRADSLAPGAEAKLWKDNARFFNKGSSGQWHATWSDANLQQLEKLVETYPADYMDWLFSGGVTSN